VVLGRRFKEAGEALDGFDRHLASFLNNHGYEQLYRVDRDYDGVIKYVTHFPKGQLPPVRGFWSDANYFFVPSSSGVVARYGNGDVPVSTNASTAEVTLEATTFLARRPARAIFRGAIFGLAPGRVPQRPGGSRIRL
jgi:hypothetical protein